MFHLLSCFRKFEFEPEVEMCGPKTLLFLTSLVLSIEEHFSIYLNGAASNVKHHLCLMRSISCRALGLMNKKKLVCIENRGRNFRTGNSKIIENTDEYCECVYYIYCTLCLTQTLMMWHLHWNRATEKSTKNIHCRRLFVDDLQLGRSEFFFVSFCDHYRSFI